MSCDFYPCNLYRPWFRLLKPQEIIFVYCVMNFSKFYRSFVTGFVGLIHAIGSEQSMRLHCVAALGVIAAGLMVALKPWEWIMVLLCIGLVLSAECMNTALERLANRVSQETHPLIKQAKDCSSAAVLVLALMAASVGLVIFLPRIRALTGW
jgi:diacylglycerol kinase